MDIKIFETFAGIGAQHKALQNISKKHKNYNLKVENAGISEWYIHAIIAYAKIHFENEFKKELENIKTTLSKKDILKLFQENPYFVFSSDSKKPSKLIHVKENILQELYAANIVSKNYGSIDKITGNILDDDIDIFTYSFPCQAISLQGKQGGLTKDSGTSSSLIWQILRILEEMKKENKLPKVLLMENVKALFSKKYIDTWNEVKIILDSLGYNTYDTTINAIDKGSIQARERVFAVSVRKDINRKFTFTNITKKTNKKIKDILENKVDEKYILNHLKEFLHDEFATKKSGIRSTILNGYTTFQSENILYSIDGYAPTCTASGANSRLKIIDANNDLRYLTPKEFWQLMDFDIEDFNKVLPLSDSILYKLAGNSISVLVLEDIFLDIIEQVLS